MTRDSLKLPTWAPWLVPILIGGLMGMGAAQVTLGGKEDASAHAADISTAREERTALKVELQGALMELRFEFDKKAIRDSAAQSETRRLLLDIQQTQRKGR